MFNTYAEEFLNPKVCEEGFSYTPANPVMPIPRTIYVVSQVHGAQAARTTVETFRKRILGNFRTPS